MKVKTELEIFEDYERPDLESRILKIAATQLTDAIESQLLDQMQTAVIEAVTGKIGDVFLDVVDNPIKKTNAWGEPKGDPVSLREVILEHAQTWLAEKVDSRGERTRYHGDKGCPRIEFIVRKVIQDEFNSLMQEEIKQLREIARAEIAELKKLFNAAQSKS